MIILLETRKPIKGFGCIVYTLNIEHKTKSRKLLTFEQLTAKLFVGLKEIDPV